MRRGGAPGRRTTIASPTVPSSSRSPKARCGPISCARGSRSTSTRTARTPSSMVPAASDATMRTAGSRTSQSSAPLNSARRRACGNVDNAAALPTVPQENRTRSSGHLMCCQNRTTSFAIDRLCRIGRAAVCIGLRGLAALVDRLARLSAHVDWLTPRCARGPSGAAGGRLAMALVALLDRLARLTTLTELLARLTPRAGADMAGRDAEREGGTGESQGLRRGGRRRERTLVTGRRELLQAPPSTQAATLEFG